LLTNLAAAGVDMIKLEFEKELLTTEKERKKNKLMELAVHFVGYGTRWT
jgi:hypothetical protein